MTVFPALCPHCVVASSDLMHFLLCWLFHQRQREVLLAGILPGGIAAIVFCWRCDQMRGRAVKVLKLDPIRPMGS